MCNFSLYLLKKMCYTVKEIPHKDRRRDFETAHIKKA